MLEIVVLILFLSLVYLVFNKNQNKLFIVLLLLVIVVGSLMTSFNSHSLTEKFKNYAYINNNNNNMPCDNIDFVGKDDLTQNEIQTWDGRRLIHDNPKNYNHDNFPLLDKVIISSPVGDDIPLTEDPVSYSFNAIDGSLGEGKPKQLFTLAYNQCRPECCPSIYSCDRGCLCLDSKQVDFINKRGNNNQHDSSL